MKTHNQHPRRAEALAIAASRGHMEGGHDRAACAWRLCEAWDQADKAERAAARNRMVQAAQHARNAREIALIGCEPEAMAAAERAAAATRR